MAEYVDVALLKSQDFQDYSDMDVQYAIDHCPRADVVPRAEVERLEQNNADRVEFFSALIEAEKRKAERLKTIAEAEAIKEFARRVKATFPSREDPRCTDDDIFTLDSIDTIMNDMLSVLQREGGGKE